MRIQPLVSNDEPELDVLPKGSMNQQLRKAVNNQQLSDITVILESETEPSKKTLYASSWMLSLRSEHFRAMLQVDLNI